MKDLMDKSSIIKLKEKGFSNRKIQEMLKIDRKTVAKYWNEYKENLQKLDNTKDSLEIKEIQERIVAAPKYNSENRVRRKITDAFLKELNKILEDEKQKAKILGTNKQALTKIQIHQLLKSKGFNVSYSSVAQEINKIKNSGKECFIKQEYNFGNRLEYDFGEDIF